jgi:hypothetical protein
MTIQITAAERSLLLSNPETEAMTSALLSKTESLSLQGTADQYDALRDACSDLLQRIGFDGDYAPTRDGLILEGLIDKLLVQ